MSSVLMIYASLAVLMVLGYLSITLRSRLELIGGWLLDKEFTKRDTLHSTHSVNSVEDHQYHRQLKKNKVIKGGGREIWVVQGKL